MFDSTEPKFKFKNTKVITWKLKNFRKAWILHFSRK